MARRSGSARRFGSLDCGCPVPSGAAEQYTGSGNFGRSYDVLPDGRFVMMRRADQSGAREIVLIQNFVEELKRLAPGK